MAKVYTFLADGFEMVEALAVVDVLRRAGVEVVTVSVSDSLEVLSAHKVVVKADSLFEDNDYSDGDVLFLPGGMPGTRNLDVHQGLRAALTAQYERGGLLAAICAAPSVLGHLGFLKGRKATCYPGFEKELYGAVITEEGVVVDQNVVTGKGMGTAVDLGLKLTGLLVSEEKAEQIGRGIQYYGVSKH